MGKPLLIDLFCGAGGAAMGYHRAGFRVIGVDLKAQPRYPFEFHQGDALEFDLSEADAVHASPPCQEHTPMSNRWRGKGGKADQHTDLVGPTRDRLQANGAPYVIENVRGAPMQFCFELTGGMFGLRVHRPRLFECSQMIFIPPEAGPPEGHVGIYGQGFNRCLWKREDGTVHRSAASIEDGRDAMGIDWMEWRELCESIPPAYTEHIGAQLIRALEPPSG